MKQAVLLDRLKKPAPKTRPNAALLRWKSNFKPAAFKARIKKAMNYIRAGDMFQANLAQRFDALLPENFDAFAHYKELRTHNPAPFACYMNVSDGVRISSASPERFLTVRGKAVTTRPIKGTRPRSNDPEANARAINDLQQSEKERAENIMIVDLLRNDLSKCCEAASIEVTQLCKLESFASVHHLVSTITGMLKGGKTPVDLLRACFPGGSITGAPKIRAMEIIEELEPTRRGPYCGSMGYIGFNGDMDSNILIRTLVYERGHVSLQAGGGITAASDPDAEYEETLDKARAIFESFESESELQKVG